MRIACPQCDLLVLIGELASGQRAACPRCGGLLHRRTDELASRALALAIASTVLLITANLFPFLSLRASGLEQVMTLPGSAIQLYDEGLATIAVLVLGPIVGIPAIIIATVVALVVPLWAGHPRPWLVPLGRVLFFLNPWSMVEVFVIAVLVSLVKIGAMATVILGISFWSYVAFAICFTAMLGTLDRVQLWSEIEACGT